jgi:hypothetical protein
MAVSLNPSGLTLGSTTIDDWDDVGGGKVLQVEQAVKTDRFTGASNTWHKITGLTQSITPSSTANKVLVQVSLVTTDGNNYPAMFHIYRDGSQITPNGAGNPFTGNVRNAFAFAAGGVNSGAQLGGITITFSFLDSPSTTSAVEYQLYGGKPQLAASTLVINNSNSGDVGSSTITVMEIAG